MNFNQIVKDIGAKYPIKIIASNFSKNIHDVQLISSDISLWLDNILYIGDSSELVNKPLGFTQMIVTEESFLEEAIENINDYNIALIPQKYVNSLFNFVNNLFVSTLKMTNDFNKLTAMSVSGESQQNIIDAAAEIVCNPLIIVDTSFKVLGYSENYKVKDKLWIENINRGYCTYDFLVLADELAPKQKAPENSEAYEIYCPISPTSKLGSKIYWDNTLIGYTFVFEEYSPISFKQMEFLPFISYIMSDILSKDPNFEGLHSSFSKKILNNILSSDGDFNYGQTLMQYSKIEFPKDMLCIVLELSEKSQKKHRYDQIKEQFKHIFINSFSTFYEKNLVCLVPDDKTGIFSKEKSDKLKELFNSDILSITISSSFSDIFRTKKYYTQCIKLQEILRNINVKKEIAYYKDYVFYTLLLDINDRNILYDKIHDSLPLLRGYDKENGSSLYETLKTYLCCNCNSKDTAAKLYVHRNSLSYRINKIEELTGINFSDAATIFNLNLSFCIEQYLNLV